VLEFSGVIKTFEVVDASEMVRPQQRCRASSTEALLLIVVAVVVGDNVAAIMWPQCRA
jgi:hypothetical protein